MTISCSDICDLAGEMVLEAGGTLPPFDQDWGDEEHQALYDAMLEMHMRKNSDETTDDAE